MSGNNRQKQNPRRIPRTEADVRRAEREGKNQGLEFALTVMIYVLVDKFGFTDDQVASLNQWFMTNIGAINDGTIKYEDMLDLLKDEYHWSISLK